MTFKETLAATLSKITDTFSEAATTFQPLVDALSKDIESVTDGKASLEMTIADRTPLCTKLNLMLVFKKEITPEGAETPELQVVGHALIETVAICADGDTIRVCGSGNEGTPIDEWTGIVSAPAAIAYMKTLAADENSALVKNLVTFLRS